MVFSIGLKLLDLRDGQRVITSTLAEVDESLMQNFG